MAFWKKSEDPWDWEPKKQPIPRETGSEPGDGASGLLDELRDDFQDWNENRKAAKARRETPPEPIPCPWCGQPMEPGYLIGGRDAVRLVRQRPGALRILDPEEALYIRGGRHFPVRLQDRLDLRQLPETGAGPAGAAAVHLGHAAPDRHGKYERGRKLTNGTTLFQIRSHGLQQDR